MKTYSAKPSEVTRTWYLIDASQASLGRISSHAAKLLTGKDKPQFTSHIDCGDYVVVINAEQLVVSGNKDVAKRYYSHSGFPGGLTESTLKDKKEADSPSVLRHAIRGMLPVNKLRDGRLLRLKIYPTSEHNHAAQSPVELDLASLRTARSKKEGK